MATLPLVDAKSAENDKTQKCVTTYFKQTVQSQVAAVRVLRRGIEEYRRFRERKVAIPLLVSLQQPLFSNRIDPLKREGGATQVASPSSVFLWLAKRLCEKSTKALPFILKANGTSVRIEEFLLRRYSVQQISN